MVPALVSTNPGGLATARLCATMIVLMQVSSTERRVLPRSARGRPGPAHDARREQPRCRRLDSWGDPTPGTTLVGFTDGLVERRRESLDDGLAGLRAAAERLRRPCPGDLCDGLVAAQLGGQPAEDDVTVPAVRLGRARAR